MYLNSIKYNCSSRPISSFHSLDHPPPPLLDLVEPQETYQDYNERFSCTAPSNGGLTQAKPFWTLLSLFPQIFLCNEPLIVHFSPFIYHFLTPPFFLLFLTLQELKVTPQTHSTLTTVTRAPCQTALRAW